ncbi:MAG: geranylgeranylglyceryl/heptaprenylglyceryl phosphate synthase, partial [Candidatus Aenigmatarchaeota archaeon]
MIGKVERYIREEISKYGTISFALIDSENLSPQTAKNIALKAESCGVKSILVGGSTAVDQLELDNIVKTIKKIVKIPVIL